MSLLTVTLLSIASTGLGQETFGLQEGTLYLTPNGQVLFQKDLKVTLTAGRNSRTLTLIPPHVDTAALHLWPAEDNPNITVSELGLKRAAAQAEVVGTCQELSASFVSKVEGVFTYRLAFTLNGVSWSTSNACRLTERSRGNLSSSLHMTNRSGIRLIDMNVLIPKPSAPTNVLSRHASIPTVSRQPVPRTTGGKIPPAEETAVFRLDRKISIEAGETKTFTIGTWPVSMAKTGYQSEAVCTSSRASPSQLISSAHLWSSVKTTQSRVMDLKPAVGVDPSTIRLFLGEVQLLGLPAESLTYGSATHWSMRDGIVSLYVPCEDIVLQRLQDEFREIYEGHVCVEKLRLMVTSRDNKVVTMDILEPLFRSDKFSVIETSHPYIVTDDGYLRFSVRLDPKTKKTVTYRVKYELDFCKVKVTPIAL